MLQFAIIGFDKSFVTPKAGESPNRAYLDEFDDVGGPQAYSTSTIPDFADDFDWHADTGATNHVALGMENLDSEKPYAGHDSLVVGNGKC